MRVSVAGAKGSNAGACVALVLLGWLLGLPWRAHATPVEQLSQLLLSEEQPDLVAVRYDYGGGGLLIARRRLQLRADLQRGVGH